MISRLDLLRRLLVVLLLAVWWGGFTFYALAVIPSGHEVLHSQLKQGFITQSVTRKLNWLGVAALAVALTEPLALPRKSGRFRFFLGAWSVCVVSQIALFYIHSLMDGLLDAANRTVIDEGRFTALHLTYISTATVGWLAAGLMLSMAASGPKPLPIYSDSEQLKATP
jgi:hypothetical protein